MTIKQLEIKLEDPFMSEKDKEKLTLVLKASAVLSREMQKTLIDNVNMHEESMSLLQSKKFKDATLDTILKILEHKEEANHLRRSELKIIRDKNISDPRYLEVCKKLNTGLMYCISTEEDNVLNFELQEIMSKFLDVIEKTSKKETSLA